LPERSALSSISDVFADIGSNVSSDIKKMGNVFGGSGTTSRGNVLTSSPDVLNASPTLSLDELIAKNETDKFSKKFPSAEEGALISQQIGEGLSNAGKYATSGGNFINDFVTAGDFSSPYEAGRTISSSVTQPLSFLSNKLEEGAEGAYNLTADTLEPIEDFGRGIFGADKRKGEGFRYGSNLKSTENLINFAEQQGSPSRQQLIDANSIKNISNADTDDANNVVAGGAKNAVTGGAKNAVTDGANARGSGSEKDKIEDKLNPFLDALNLNLDESKKEAFAMAMIQLGAGIAEGDLSKGLSNAGVAASGVMSKARDRQDKQLDRQIQSQYYADKLQDSREAQDLRVQKAISDEYKIWLEANFGATDKEKIDKRKEIEERYNLLGNTIATGATVSSDNQRGEVVNFDKDGNRI